MRSFSRVIYSWSVWVFLLALSCQSPTAPDQGDGVGRVRQAAEGCGCLPQPPCGTDGPDLTTNALTYVPFSNSYVMITRAEWDALLVPYLADLGGLQASNATRERGVELAEVANDPFAAGIVSAGGLPPLPGTTIGENDVLVCCR